MFASFPDSGSHLDHSERVIYYSRGGKTLRINLYTQKSIISDMLFVQAVTCVLCIGTELKELCHRKQLFPGISMLNYLLWKKQRNPFFKHYLPNSQKAQGFPQNLPPSICLRLGSPGSAVVSQAVLRNGCRMCKVGTRFPPGEEHRGYGKQVWLLFTSLVLFVSLTQLSGIHSVCVQGHTPYHPSGRLLTLGSQIQGTGHSSNRVTHCVVLFAFTLKVDILLVNRK